MTTTEGWRDVVGYEGLYEVSSLGRVRSLRRALLLRAAPMTSGYLSVRLSRGNRAPTRSVHALVAEAFVGPRPGGMNVNHIDGLKTNNAATNLEYVTPSENTNHAYRSGLAASGERHKSARLTAAQTQEIRSLIGRMTKTAIAKRFGVTRTAVHWIAIGRNWKHTPAMEVARGN